LKQEIIRLVVTNDRGTRRLVQYNENGRRCGETHHRAKLTDQQVDQIRDLREEQHWSYGRIALALGISKSAVFDICQYRKRADSIVEWRALKAIVR
jgi:hypothetical protein